MAVDAPATCASSAVEVNFNASGVGSEEEIMEPGLHKWDTWHPENTPNIDIQE